MKQLFWKEWYELRRLPLMSAVGTAVLILGYVAYVQTVEHRYDHWSSADQVADTFSCLLVAWHLTALVAGAGLFSPEIGSGNLLFLSALPVNRRRIWWTKATTALGILLVCLAVDALAFLLIDWLLFGATATIDVPAVFLTTPRKNIMFLSSVGGFFGAALAVSPFLDRTLSAVATALLLSMMSLVLLGNSVDHYERSHYGPSTLSWPAHPSVYLALGGMSILVTAAISYWTFTRGESLRSAKRFRVGALAGVVSLAVAVLVFGIGSRMLLW